MIRLPLGTSPLAAGGPPWQRVLATACLCALLAAVASAQLADPDADAAIGEWRTHLPGRSPADVAACEAFTAWVTSGAVVLRFRENDELRRLDKANVLSQANPKFVACNPDVPGQLIVVYADGGIDVLQDDRPQSYTNAIEQTDIFGRRGINGIRVLAPELAAVSTDFGYLLFDPARGVFLEDVRFASGVLDVTALDDALFVATGRGLLRLPDYRGAVNVRDTSRYQAVNTGAPPAARITQALAFDGRVYAGYTDALYSVDGLGDDPQTHSAPGACLRVRRLQADGERIVATASNTCGGDDALLTRTRGGDFARDDVDCVADLRGGAPEPGGGVALASVAFDAGLCVREADDCACTRLNGPASTNTYDIDVRNGIVAVAGGGIDEGANYTENGAGVYILRDGTWDNMNLVTTPALRQEDTPDPFDRLLDFLAVAVSPDSSVFAGAYYEGLAQRAPDGATRVIDERNSSLGLHLGDPLRVRVAGLDFDDAGNLWVSNTGADASLSVREPDGTWHAFDISACSRDRVLELVVDPRTGIVYVVDFLGGVVAFDAGDDFADTSDDRCRRFNERDNLPDVDVRSIMLDRDGILWIGTGDGIARLACTGDPFAETCTANIPTSEVDGILGTFFDDELIRSMTTDGGDRKWIGTDNGLFLLADDTDEQLAFYNEANSPLIDDQINALAFDDLTGRLWIGTNAGLMSLQTEATGSRPFVFEGVEVYPQPVRPDYDGPIAIRGLATDANVKITDVAGRLVYETNAIGGQAVWDGRDYTGNRPASGVYLVWATAVTGDPPATIVGKIALLR